MITQFVTSVDGARLAYDVSGRGPALMLLHGSNQTRAAWHAAGYVSRLQDSFKVIAVDVRGSGESDFLNQPGDFIVGPPSSLATSAALRCSWSARRTPRSTAASWRSLSCIRMA